ncbi:MAG: hypothetical protein JNK67_25380 [Alphaproteobacteria bacterium]|nr:hypothetical protein [Alphaproteobacteria bacterium]
MIADPAVLAVGVKMLATALIVVAAALAAEKAGPQLGGMIASLPVSAGPAYVFLALKSDDAFIAASALSSLISNAGTALFLLFLALYAARLSAIASILGAIAVWCATIAVYREIPLGLGTAIGLNVASYGGAILIARRLRFTVPAGRVGGGLLDLLLRAVLVAGLVGLVVAASDRIGPAMTGLVALMPLTFTSVGLLIHSRLGGEACAAAMASALVTMIGFPAGLVAVHVAAVPLGRAVALVLGLLVMLAWSALVLWWRRRRLRAPAA